MEREFTAVIEKRGQWYVAYVEEIPGVNTQGRTLTEARRNLKEALRLILETNRRQQLRTQQERRDSRPRRTHGCRMRAA
jgi:predicted RNase H-like HicB family nuclease